MDVPTHLRQLSLELQAHRKPEDNRNLYQNNEHLLEELVL